MAAKKTTTKKGVEKETTAKVDAKSAEKNLDAQVGGNNTNIMILAGAALALIIIAGAIFFLIGGDGGDNGEVGDIMAKSFVALQSVDSYGGDLDMTISMSGESMGQPLDVEMDMAMEMINDVKNEKSYSKITMKAEGTSYSEAIEQTVESYMIGGTSYTKIEDPYLGGEQWIKMETVGNPYETLSPESMSELMDLLEGKVVGTETVNGKETTVVVIEADMAKVMKYLIETQIEQNPDMYMLMSADQMVELLGDAIKEFSMKLWISNDDYLPVRVEGVIVMEIDIGDLYGGIGGAGSLGMDMSFSGDFDYDTPVDIQLPAAAMDAGSIEDLYDYGNYGYYGDYDNNYSFDPVCGDGWCDYNEDSVNCSEDCYCGDFWCDATEDNETCPADCMSCGNGWCDWDESSENCPEDCFCGDDWCANDEDSESCPDDCFCGDYWCDAAETVESCPEDCASGIGIDEELAGCVDLCGDETCQEIVCQGTGCPCSENEETCPADCSGTIIKEI